MSGENKINNKSHQNNNTITSTKYFKIDDAINASINSKTVFIIANERITKTGHIGRYFTIFPSFKSFLKQRNKFKHCHEIIVDHINNKPNIAGRLVFDFDIKKKDENNKKINIPENFKDQIEDTIIDVVDRYFININSEIMEYIWSTSKNPEKFSKHLTVKNLYFDDWISISKIFYKLFCLVWDEKYLWIKSNKLIDFQIVRNRGSLRMVGSTKINGYPLVFDNEHHKLTDSLIRIYFKNRRDEEQLVKYNNINSYVFENILQENISQENILYTTCENNFFYIEEKNPKKSQNMMYNKKIYIKAFEIYNNINPDIFEMGKIYGDRISLLRRKSHKCLISGKVHDSENAFCKITKDEENSLYSIKFGCYRGCHRSRPVYIASMSGDSMFVMYSPDYEKIINSKKKKEKIKNVVEI